MSTTSPFREDTEAAGPFASVADRYAEAFDEGESWEFVETDEAADLDAGPFAEAAEAEGDFITPLIDATRRTPYPATLLKWPGAPERALAFMRAVYDRHRRNSRARRPLVVDLPRDALDVIEGRIRARRDVARAARALLAEARTALAASPHAGRLQIGVVGGHRTIGGQFARWQAGFSHYYGRAVREGVVRQGDYGPAAAERLAQYVGKYMASPGFSDHQHGLAVDFGSSEPGGRLAKIRARSWFHEWLRANAGRFGFRPYDLEPWHWEFRPGAASQQELAEAWETEEEEWEEPDWEEEAEEEAVFVDEAEEEAAHPILTLFPLPTAVLDALSRGLWSLALGLAFGAGYRDVNKLTNIIFYFRHPEAIGRKIRSDERDLAQDWLAIRDRIVKPALKSITAGAPPVSVPAAPTVVAGTTPSSPPIPASRVQWKGSSPATPEQLAFKRAVYEQHFRNSSRIPGNTYVADLPDGALDWIDDGKRHRLRKDAAAAARALFAEARAALAASPYAGRRHIGVRSAYRPATEQFAIWQGAPGRGFHGYYQWALNERLVSPGDYGPEAVKAVARRLGKCVAFPGYSNHQDGLAMDVGEGAVGKGIVKIREKTWFHPWLVENAKKRFHFYPLKDEPWHWVYRPPAQSEVWAGEVGAAAGVRAGRLEVARVPLLARHRGNPPALVLRWNDMPSGPQAIDVVVHLHGYSRPGMKLPKQIEPYSGLDLAPVDGAAGQARSRPTLTVLPRAHFTGVKQKHGNLYVHTFPALVAKDALPKLVQFALDRFAAQIGGPAPRVGRLILTAHSGGGQPLMEILKHHDPHEVHVFDALYWSPGPLAEWARKHIRQDRAAGTPSGALRVFYGRGTRRFSRQLLEAIAPELDASVADRYRVEASTLGHWQIPRQYGWRVLADASADVPNAQREPVGKRELEVFEEARLEEWEEPVVWQGEDLEEGEEALAKLAEAVFEGEPDDELFEAEWEPELWHETEEAFEEAEPEWEEELYDEEAAPTLRPKWESESFDAEDPQLVAATAAHETLSSAVEVSDLDRGRSRWEAEDDYEEEAEDGFELGEETPAHDALSAAFEAADLVEEAPLWEAEDDYETAAAAPDYEVQSAAFEGADLTDESSLWEADDEYEAVAAAPEYEAPPTDEVDAFLESRLSLYKVALVGMKVLVTLPRSYEWTARYTEQALRDGAVGAAMRTVYGSVPAAKVRKVMERVAAHGVEGVTFKPVAHKGDLYRLTIDDQALKKVAWELNLDPKAMTAAWRSKLGEAILIDYALRSADKSFDALVPHFSAKELAAKRMSVELIRRILKTHPVSMIEVAKRHPAAAPWREAFKKNLALYWAEREPKPEDLEQVSLSDWARTILVLAAATRDTVNKQIDLRREEERKYHLNEHLRPHEIKVDNAAAFILETFEPTRKERLPTLGWIIHGGQALSDRKGAPIYLLRVESDRVIYQHLGNRKFYRQSLEGFDEEMLFGIYVAAGEKAAGVIPLMKWVIGLIGVVFPVVKVGVLATDVINAGHKLARNRAEIERHYEGVKLAYGNIDALVPGVLPKIWDAVLDKRNVALFNPLENPDVGAWLKVVIRLVMMRQTRIAKGSYAADAVDGFLKKAWAAIKKGLGTLVTHVIVVAPAVAGSTGISGQRALEVAAERLEEIGVVDSVAVVRQIWALPDADRQRLLREIDDLVKSGTKLMDVLKRSLSW